ncbi:unnamed protein product [Rotaria magnacalcarata]|uniref:HAT C-terminal dimerisation domain-containing protein n=1 Tax=Rotaria magnacalcarata TaxID=392030 RepID=A0A815VNI8_9BILA|nr:unnamed protein product [Rotaria magnacalcarata]CAF1534382.1 unnamed protein product [Rotaria magnacalcarata]CAF3865940.1 unnamed protein product [Rotaria magnacalcarata]CAF3882447.1 unnamed protein product [Rotaria magnacalcarata]
MLQYSNQFLCKIYVRQQLKEIDEREQRKRLLLSRRPEKIIEQTDIVQPPQKKQRRFGEEYESGYLSDEYGEAEDEVDKCLFRHIDSKSVVDNPPIFWKENQKSFPLLSKLARMVHCISATTAVVEWKFSGSDLIMTERRCSIKPKNIDNILFLRSVTRGAVFELVFLIVIFIVLFCNKEFLM